MTTPGIDEKNSAAKSDLRYFSWYFRNFFSLEERGTIFMLFWISYLIPRAIFGTKGKNAVKAIFRNSAAKKERTISFPLEGKVRLVKLRDLPDFDVFHEICIRDFYGMADFVKAGMVVVDVGANIGTFSVVAGTRVGSRGRVIAFEPEERNFAMAKANVGINALTNVMVNQMAIADYSGMGKLYVSSNNEGHSLLSQGASLDEVGVEVTTVDETLRRLDIKSVDVLKIDVEGFEQKALEGARKTIENSPRIKIMVDVIHYPGEQEEITAYLNSLGFSTTFTKDFIFAECSNSDHV